MVNVRLILEWLDQAGGFIRASNWVFSPAGLATLEAALQACANPTLQFATAAIPSVSAAPPGSALYPFTSDTAVLIYRTVPGSDLRVVIPGPVASIFGPGSNVVDPTSPLVVALNAAVIGTLGDAGGNAASGFIQGVKSSRRTEQP